MNMLRMSIACAFFVVLQVSPVKAQSLCATFNQSPCTATCGTTCSYRVCTENTFSIPSGVVNRLPTNITVPGDSCITPNQSILVQRIPVDLLPSGFRWNSNSLILPSSFRYPACTMVPVVGLCAMSCSASTPACDGVSCVLNVGTPTASGQAWVQGAANCGFSCTGGYTGSLCEIPPIGNFCESPPICAGLSQCTIIANAPSLPNQSWSLGGVECGYACNPGYSVGVNCDPDPTMSTGTTTTTLPPAANSCASTTPSCSPGTCSLTTGSPSMPDQAWVLGSANCGFSCINGFTGSQCEIAPTCHWSASVASPYSAPTPVQMCGPGSYPPSGVCTYGDPSDSGSYEDPLHGCENIIWTANCQCP